MHRTRLACTVSLMLIAGTAFAGIDNAGTTAGNFLSVGTGAAILSMGGAAIGGGSDLHASAWNPAALAQLGSTQLALSHASLGEQSSQEWLAAGGRVGRDATRWAVTALYQGDGSFDGRDAFGASTGSFNVSSMAVGLRFARPIGANVNAGLGASWLNDHLGDANGHGLSFDAGVQAQLGAFGVGAAARNVGGSMQYAEGRFDLPAVVGVGASWSDARTGLRLALDANFPSAYYNDVRAGAEWRWQERVALRAGYRMELGANAGEPLGGPSFGVGAGANGVWMDYAFLANGAEAQGQHRLALTFHPGVLNHGARPIAESNARESHADAPIAAAAPKPATVRAPKPEPVAAVTVPAPAPRPAAVAVVTVPAPVVVAPAPVVVPTVTPTPAANATSSDAIEPEMIAANVIARMPADAAASAGATPRAPKSSGSIVPSKPARAVALVMPTPAEQARIARDAAPAPVAAPKPAPVVAAPVVAAPVVAAPTPAPVAVVMPTPAPPVAEIVAPAPGKPAKPAKPAKVRAPKPEPVAVVPATPAPTPAPLMDAPAPVATSEPAPIAQVASSAPRIVVVSRPAEPTASAPKHVSRPVSVTVGDNETLADIAKRYQTSVAAIMMQNNLVSERVKKGQKLKLPQD